MIKLSDLLLSITGSVCSCQNHFAVLQVGADKVTKVPAITDAENASFGRQTYVNGVYTHINMTAPKRGCRV